MALRELTDAEWQHSFVPVLRLAGPGSSTPAGDADPRSREHAVGDVKHVMDKTIGKRCCRISGAVSAANYLEVPREARTAPLSLTGRFVYIQVRPIGTKPMTFHLDVLDSDGQPTRATFSTLYSESPAVSAAAEPFITQNGSRGRDTTSSGSKHANGVGGGVGVGGGSSGGGGCAEGLSSSRALVRRGGALRCPVSFDTSRSLGWTVVAVDLVKLMSQGQGQAGGKGYKSLRGVRLGANMVVRGVYVSDCVYSPRTLPKEMTFRVPGDGDWETTYGWLWLPEVPEENVTPPPPPPPLQDGVRSNRPAWPPGAESPTSSVAAADAAEAHGRRRMEKRHFQTRSSSLGKLLAHDVDDGGDDEAAAVVARNDRAAGPPSPRRAQGGPPVKKLSAGSAGGAAPASVSWRNSSSSSSKRMSLSVSPVRGARARSKSVGAGGRSHPPTPPRAAHAVATPTRLRRANASAAVGAVTPRGKTPSRVRHRGNFVSSPIAAATNGRPPLSPKVGRPGRGTPTPRVRKKKAFFCDGDGDVVGDTTTGGVDGGDSREGIARGEQGESWTRREHEDWAPDSGDRAPATPSVAVLGATGRAVDKSGWSETKGGPDPPVVTRMLPLGLENHRPNPPEFEPDPALHLERALGYTGGLPETLAFLGGSAFVAFPSNNVIVLIETPVMPEPFFPARGEENTGGGRVGDEKKADDEPLPAPHAFLRGHTDTVTLLRVSNGGHLLASAQGDPLGAAGGHGIVRIWDTSSLGHRAGAGDGDGGGGKCFVHFEGHRWGVTSMCFSSDDRLLCTVGGDELRRTQVVVWDVGILCSARAGAVQGAAVRRAIVARQISDFPITRILFSPFEKLRLVSCGRENVRFWRIRRQHLPACPAVLNDFARDLECTDLAFQRACHGIAGAEGGVDWGDGPCVVYVSSRVGTVLQVSYHTRNLLCVLQLHDEPILSLTVTEWCAITCSADKLLRLWPLDFSDSLMEAAHESSVVSACSSGDGLKLAVGTAEGSIGVLDVMTHGYTTALRSHRGSVTAAAVNPCPEREEFATVSEDCTVRVWDLVTGAQLYQFSSPEDGPTCIAYAPPYRRNGPEESFIAADAVASKWGVGEEGDEGFPRERHLVAGYASGAMRVFDVPTASTVFECQQHDSAVHEVVFTPDGSRVVSAGADGLMCVYDACRGYLPTRVVACDTPEPGCRIRLAVSPGSDRLAVIGTEPSCILLYELSSMVLKRRLGKPGRKGIGVRSFFGVASGGSGTGMGGVAPRSYRSKSYDSIAAGAGIGAGGADVSGGAMSGGFLHAEFSEDGSEILACTATKLFRFSLGGGDVNAWSSLLPCKAGPAVGACYPPSGPGLVVVSPAVVGAGGATDTANHGNGYSGSKRGATARGMGGGGSELFLSRVHRDDQSSSVALSAPQAFAAHAAPLTAVAFSPVGDRLVTCDSTGVVLLWTNLAAPRPEAWATSRTLPPQNDASRVAANDGVRRAGGNLFSGKHRDICEDHVVGAMGVGSDVSVVTANTTAAVASRVRPMTFPESDDDEEDQEGDEESISRDGMIFDDVLPASSEGTGRIPAPLDLIASNCDHGGESEEAKWREMETRGPESGVGWAPAASARPHRGRGGVAAGLPPLAPVTPSGRKGRGDGFASMLDQPLSPVVAAEATAVHVGFDRAASGTPRAKGGPRPSGQFTRALASLQTAVNETAAAVGEAEAGTAESSSRQGKEEEKGREANRSFETSSPVSEDEGLDGCFDGAGRMRVGVGEPLWSKNEKVGVGERFDSKKPNVSAPVSAAAVAVREAASNQGGEAECVTWQPSSGRLLYTQGDSLFAEELDSCRRWVLFDSCGPGARAASPVVAVSGCGEYIARASGRHDPNGVSGDRLSVWRLSRNNTTSNSDYSGSSSDCNGCGSDFGGGVNDQRPEVDLNYAVSTVLEATEEDGIVALAFSPSGSEVCSLGEWDGSRCLLRTRSLSATACCSAGTIAGVSAINNWAVTSVTPLAAKTSAICVLSGREDWHDGRQSFRIVTGGHEGVALWTRARRGGKSSGVGGTGAIDGIHQCARESEGDGGVRLLGAYPGVRATALASVGRFVIAAEVFGAPGRVSVTAMDVDWLAAGGHHSDKAAVAAGTQRLVDDEEFSWLAFGGSDDVSITSLATAGSRSVAVGGSGGKLEIWDVEAVFREVGRTRKGARAGLVRRLDLRDALLGASVTDMTWDAGGTDAVLGAGGKIWHLHVPRVSDSHGTISLTNRGPAEEPTLARVWPGGNVQAG